MAGGLGPVLPVDVMDLQPITGPPPGQATLTELDMENNAARVVLFFTTGQTSLTEEHKGALRFIASMLADENSQAEIYACCDRNGTDATNDLVAMQRLNQAEAELFSAGAVPKTTWRV